LKNLVSRASSSLDANKPVSGAHRHVVSKAEDIRCGALSVGVCQRSEMSAGAKVGSKGAFGRKNYAAGIGAVAAREDCHQS
jgi:hypothetical protein